MAFEIIGDGLALRSKGDLISNDGAFESSIIVGTNSQILTARSSATTGLAWENPPAVLTTYVEHISSSVLTTSAGTITFTSIPSGYRDLRLFAIIKRTATTSGNTGQITWKINNSTGALYSEARYCDQNGSLTVNQATTSVSYATQGSSQSDGGPNSHSSIPYSAGIMWFDFFNYADTTVFKNVSFMKGSMNGATTASPYAVEFGSYQFLDTAAITRLDFSVSSWAAPTAFHLWGIK
jgi:hypothetical protein